MTGVRTLIARACESTHDTGTLCTKDLNNGVEPKHQNAERVRKDLPSPMGEKVKGYK
jgi:hypothetical protein